MFGWLKKRKKKAAHTEGEEKPGRTFTPVLLGECFGLQDRYADASAHRRAKEEKAAKIAELGLKPAYMRYVRKMRSVNGEEHEVVVGARVAFQKEEYNEARHMINVTEIAFFVPSEEFEEFEALCGVRLEAFRDLTDYEYKGEERRKKPRKEFSVNI